MILDRLPIFRLFDLRRLRTDVEPVRYNYSRDCIAWADVRAVLDREAGAVPQR
jgi:hypothetical protein